MYNIADLLDAYRKHDKVELLFNEFSGSTKKISLKGICGSSDAFLAAAFWVNKPAIHVFIRSSKEEAAY
ncbi:MAG: hypothetical protein NZ522_09385, partial [Chitinophagales bacterium]|nr:hypothetical protein [Chitinophagales bacterium]